jgi:hypothetical protein
MMTTGAPKNLSELKAMANAMRRRLQTMFPLSDNTDPWNAEQEYRSKWAYWIAEVVERLGISLGVHVRAVFYKLVSQKTPVIQVDGEPFVNTVDCFEQLGIAIRDGRYLGMIPADAIIDRRNPEPIINLADNGDVVAEIMLNDGGINRAPFGVSYSAPTLELPEVLLIQDPKIGQRYHIEIWIEKSTANDVLLPLGREYGINVATFVGEVSTTACKNLVSRAIKSGRPVRILHVTDFDPAGRCMPVSAAAKIDFFAVQSGVPDLDIKLEHVALTQEQCVQYQLPRTPIKETEGRGAGFEARFGEGATELDALEALHPGALREILVGHIERYYDHDLDDAVDAAIDRFRAELDDAEEDVRADHEEELDEIKRRRTSINDRFAEVRNAAQAAYDAVVKPARQAYEAILAKAEADRTAAIETVRAEIEKTEEQLVKDAEALLETMGNEMWDAAPDPATYDWPEPAEGDEDDDALYHSTRDYFDQLNIFRAHQGKDDEVGYALDRIVAKTCAVCGDPFIATGKALKKKYCGRACSQKAYERRQAAKADDVVS